MDKKKLLIVDDEESVRLFLREELEEEGYEVEIASGGLEALRMLEEKRFDLVVLDIRMPGMDGIETLHEIKKKNESIPVVLCTAYGEYQYDFASWLSDAYVVKSSQTDDLKRTIRELLVQKNTGV